MLRSLAELNIDISQALKRYFSAEDDLEDTDGIVYNVLYVLWV